MQLKKIIIISLLVTIKLFCSDFKSNHSNSLIITFANQKEYERLSEKIGPKIIKKKLLKKTADKLTYKITFADFETAKKIKNICIKNKAKNEAKGTIVYIIFDSDPDRKNAVKSLSEIGKVLKLETIYKDPFEERFPSFHVDLMLLPNVTIENFDDFVQRLNIDLNYLCFIGKENIYKTFTKKFKKISIVLKSEADWDFAYQKFKSNEFIEDVAPYGKIKNASFIDIEFNISKTTSQIKEFLNQNNINWKNFRGVNGYFDEPESVQNDTI